MKITIEADAKEIAAFVLELQKRQEGPYEIKVALDKKDMIAAVLEAVHGKPEATRDFTEAEKQMAETVVRHMNQEIRDGGARLV